MAKMIGLKRLAAIAAASVLAASIAQAEVENGEEDDLEAARAFLVEQIVGHAALAAEVTGRPEIDGRVLEAIGKLPRHEFVAEAAAPLAYFDVPLPAEHDLRESQPYIVAMMTDLVAPGPDDDVLILGIGGGYHAALASTLAARVYSLDLDAAAAGSSMERLDRLGYENIEIRVTDPYYGWPDTERQFDAIIIRLAVDTVPNAVLRQLRPGGRLVAPVGRADTGQELTLFTKDEDGEVDSEVIMPVLFMRLPGGERI
jgi:protein-L-isoaspartate(D-aspartate) O-methyltransferase